jgi:uncharacterized repeat protein (TIGR01451 family)
MKNAFWSVLVCLLISAPAAFGQADQQIVSVLDAPDPVVPGNNITYTVTETNNGPNPAVNGGININLPGNVTLVGTTAPAGFTCTFLGAIGSCTHPSFAVGTANFSITVQIDAALLNFPDGTLTANFSTSGVTPDPNPGNNTMSATTTYDSPQFDLSVTASDSPDPVTPDSDITYTVPVTNAGDTATSVNFNVFNNGSLRFQSATAPGGWSCTLPAVNATPTFTCTKPSFAAGTDTFTVVVRADSSILGLNDQTVSTTFSVNGTGNDTNNGNNSETENTAYVTPDANVAITSATDSPDPVSPDGNITYTVNVGNGGPDTATNVVFTVPLNNTLKFQSITVPAGFSCSLPPVGGGTTFTCTNPSWVSGANGVFTVVLKADAAAFGTTDQTITQTFSISSSTADPNNANNSQNVSTAYDAPQANLGVAVTDAPDPVAAGALITYSGTVTNGGPDTASNSVLTIPLDANLRFQSLTGPGGFTCSTPAIGATGTITCTNASFASGGDVPFSLVARVPASLNSGPDGTIQQSFSISSDATDATPANNSVQLTTAYTTPDANLSTTNADAPDPAVQGATITYTQTITNNGPDAAVNAALTETLPASITFQSIVAPAGFTCTTPAVGSSGAITCTIASLASGVTGTFTLVTNVVAPSGTVSLTTTVSSDTFDPDGANNTATATTTIASQADVSIAKTTASIVAVTGSTVTYTLTVSNAGPGAATSVVVTDVLPAGLAFVSATPSQGTCVGTSTVTCSLGTLANGANATIVLTTTVTANSGSVANSASVASATVDPNPGNSTVSAAVLPVSASIPTMSQWMLILLALALGFVAIKKA